MNKKQVMHVVKKLMAGVLAVGMIILGIVIYSRPAHAEDVTTIKDKVIYEQYSANDIAKYWTAEEKTAPIKEGYVFGGWFKQVTEATKTTKTETYTVGEKTEYYDPLTIVEGECYAKFVPAQVLSVKAQNGVDKDSSIQKIDKTTINNISKNNPMWVRVMSSLDSANYQKVGFEIFLANWKQVYKDEVTQTPTETTKIYTGLKVGNETKTANQVFGGESEYLSVWQLTAIDTPSNASLIIYVRPYWITTDGTKVEGLAKYVHIEDDYMGYVSVPINILNKEVTAKLAAGRVDMTYSNANANETVALTFKEVESGRLLPEMNATKSGNVIKMVGNAKTTGQYNSTETLYANVRFIKPQDANTTDVDVNFNVDMLEFCDWNEDEVAINEAWDVKYDVP